MTCSACGGRGEIQHLRCPNSMTDAFGRAAVQAASFASYGAQPASGGWGEQVAVGATLVDVVNSEIAKIRESIENPDG